MTMIKQTINFVLLLTFIVPAQFANAQVGATDLQKYILAYQGPYQKTKLESAMDALQKIEEARARYRAFYKGPENNGKSQPEVESWQLGNIERAGQASELLTNYEVHGLVDKFLDALFLKSNEEVNLFSLELMRRYLDEPAARPALKELIEALQSKKFNKTYKNAQDLKRDPLVSFGEGFVIAASALFVFCVFRAQSCSNLVIKQEAMREGQMALRASAKRNVTPKRILRNFRKSATSTAKMGEITIEDLLREIKMPYGHAVPSAAESVGSAITKRAAFKRYYLAGFQQRLIELGAVAGVGAIGGGMKVATDKSLQARADGKFEYELLKPHELEQKYFSALAVLEMTCQARVYANDEKAPIDEVASFVVDANEQVLLLKRMAGGMAVFHKTPLEFVKVGDDSDLLDVHLMLAADKPFDFTLPCPKATSLAPVGGTVYASLGELDSLLTELIARLPKPLTTPTPAADQAAAVKKH